MPDLRLGAEIFVQCWNVSLYHVFVVVVFNECVSGVFKVAFYFFEGRAGNEHYHYCYQKQRHRYDFYRFFHVIFPPVNIFSALTFYHKTVTLSTPFIIINILRKSVIIKLCYYGTDIMKLNQVLDRESFW